MVAVTLNITKVYLSFSKYQIVIQLIWFVGKSSALGDQSYSEFCKNLNNLIKNIYVYYVRVLQHSNKVNLLCIVTEQWFWVCNGRERTFVRSTSTTQCEEEIAEDARRTFPVKYDLRDLFIAFWRLSQQFTFVSRGRHPHISNISISQYLP